MKKIIYGLDLGVASIGWAVISINENGDYQIEGMGSPIIPYSDTEGDEFGKGVGESVNQQRTTDRTSRKGLDRYQLRRTLLNKGERTKLLRNLKANHNILTNGPQRFLTKLLGKLKTNRNRQKNNKALLY